MKTFTAIALVAGLASALPASDSAAATTTYACNPAHAYPNGASCISTAGSLTLVTPSVSAAPSGDKKSACDKSYNDCRVAPNANQAYCASQYAGCLGYNPFANNGTNTVTPQPEGDTYVTQVVTRFTTYCPEPTTLTYNNKTYTVTSATTLTISNCPCTVTTPAKSVTPVPPPVQSATPKETGTAQPPPNPAVTPSTKPGSVLPTGNAPSQTVSAPASTRSAAQYTGAADKLNVGGALMLGAFGLLAL